jgi:hypothetical protein
LWVRKRVGCIVEARIPSVYTKVASFLPWIAEQTVSILGWRTRTIHATPGWPYHYGRTDAIRLRFGIPFRLLTTFDANPEGSWIGGAVCFLHFFRELTVFNWKLPEWSLSLAQRSP